MGEVDDKETKELFIGTYGTHGTLGTGGYDFDAEVAERAAEP